MNYKFKTPSIDDFAAEYYFSERTDAHDARIFPPHLHDRMELYILLEGDVSFMVESKLYKLSSGDAILTKPNEMHNCILNTRSVHKHLCFWFDVSSEFLFGDFLTHEFGENNLLSPSEQSKARLFTLYDQLKTATEENDTRRQFYLLLELLDIFAKSIPTQSQNQPLPPVLKSILADIDEQFTTITHLQFFTDKYFISQSTLNRLFHNHLHTTPKLYIETKRLAYARQLLKQGKSVLSACMEAGFPDYSNFIRLFKRRFNTTPRQYKNS